MHGDQGVGELPGHTSPDEGEAPLVLDPRTEGQVPPVRPAAPAPRGRDGGLAHADGSDGETEGPGLPGGAPPSRGSPGLHRPQAEERRGRRGADARVAEEYSRESLPPVAEHEVEVLVPDALSYTVGQSTRSEPRTVGNFRFRILVFPSGTQNTGGAQVSAFVEADPVEGLDPRWCFQNVKYQVAVVNWADYRRSVVKSDTWTFSKDGIDRGWHDMVRVADLSAETGWLGPGQSLCIRASCFVRQADAIAVGGDYNNRRETGQIGLTNHGATCYMNGLLQSLFHLGEFRRIVYSIGCDEAPEDPGKDAPAPAPAPEPELLPKSAAEDADAKAPPLIAALQNVFYRLQTAEQAVNCRELMKSFGWDTVDAFTQHDAQELNRILCDRLEEQMKGSPMDGSIKRLFEGEMENYIECIDVDYKSRRNETFYDIQLNIKGERGQELRSIEESLREFTNEETLEGDNAYEAEGHGKQRARKGIRFLTFPPVLNLQLKRFHFDLEKMDMVKLNSRFEFYRRLDLSSFAPGAGTYLLHAVVVHSGDVNSGHYWAHIRPNLDNGWFKFDDETVTPCSDFAAVEDNYGGSDLMVWSYFDRPPRELRVAQTPVRPRIHNAYMLVYIREDMAQDVLRVPDPLRVNSRMVERCDREVWLAEQRRREKMEQQLRIRIRLVLERDLRRMTGFWDHAEIPHSHTLKMGRDQTVKELVAEAEAFTGLPHAHLAVFSLHYRSNPRQVRFAFMPTSSPLRSHIPQFSAPHFDASDPYLTVLCVAAQGYDPQSLEWRPAREGQKPEELARWHDEQVTLLVVKYFCAQARRIVTLGAYYMQNSEPLLQMVSDGWVQEQLRALVDAKEVAPLPEDLSGQTWECWEEFSERDVQPRSVKRAVKSEQLWSGDVVIWQLAPQPRGAEAGAAEAGPPAAGEAEAVAPVYPVDTVADFAAHLANSVEVTVTLHDALQPLCVDGVVANGCWGPPRAPAGEGKEASPPKEERPEDLALAASPARFQAPREKELRMDLRWQLHHVTGTVAQAFGLEGHEALRLFHAAPASTSEEPLDAQARGEEPTLRELQRSAAYTSAQGRRPLQLHAVELPLPLGRQAAERGAVPLCVRFFDVAVREVGSCIVAVPSSGTVEDVLQEAQARLQPEWGIQAPLRAMEVVDGRLHKLYRPEHLVRLLTCCGKSNVLYHCLRVEADHDSARVAEGQRLLEIFHCDRHSQQAFAQPLLLAAAPGEAAGSLKARCKERLCVPDAEFRSWRLVRSGGRAGRVHLKDEEPWDSDASPDARLCLEHAHPNPMSSTARQGRHNKPLTIK